MNEVPDEHRGPPPPGPTRTNVDPMQRLAPDAVLAGRYRVRRLLGVGGMGMVYLVHDKELDLEVALKVLRPELAGESSLVERFRRELVLARQVSHRHVVRIHDIGQDGDLYFLTMDFVEGRSLRDLLSKDGPLPVARAVEVARQLAAALAVAHEEGVVHRDLKPSNVMIDGSGRAYITDFGVARSLTAVGLTQTGAVVGTPDYLSPEQAKGDSVDGRSDLYSLGVILFEMLTGELPFESGSFAEAVAQRIAGRPPSLDRLGSEVPPGVKAAIRRCLEPAPSRRYQSAAELAADLADPARAPAGVAGRRATVAAAAVALLLALLAGGWLLLRRPAVETEQSAAPSAREISLAVLPLGDETGSPGLAWLGSGLAEMLAEGLAESPALRVADSGRLFQALEDLKLTQGPWNDAVLERIGEIFDADRLVHGRVRTTGDGLRVDARIAQRLPGGEIRATPVVAETAGIDVSALVAALDRELRARLEVPTPPEEAVLSSSPEALRSYGEGLDALARGDAVAAEPALRRAAAADPAFGAAWHRLAEALEALGRPEEAREASDRAVAEFGDSSGRLALAARARQAALEGDPARAREILLELRRLYPHDLEAAVSLADASGQQGELQEAIAALRGVVERAPNHPRAWFLLSKYSILAGDSRAAIDEYLVRAMVIQNRLRNDRGRAEVLNAFGVAYRELGDLERAEDSYRQAADLRREIGDERGYVTTLGNLGQVQIFRGQFDAADRSLQDALRTLEELGDDAGRADVLNDLGILEEERGRYAPALERYREALRIRRDLGDRRAEAESLNNVGYAYYLLGEHDNASVYWRQALELFRDTGNQEGVVQASQSLAQLQLTRGNWQEATKSYLSALELAREIEYPSATAVSLGYLGRIAQYQGRYAAALASFDEALTILGRLEDLRGLTEFTIARAETLREIGLLDEAGAALERAAGWLEGTQNHEQLAELALQEAILGRERDDTGEAAARLAVAEQEAEASSSALARVRVRLERARLERRRGRLDAAAREIERVIAEGGRLGDRLSLLAAGEEGARLALAAGDAAQAETRADEALRLARTAAGYAGTHRLYHLLAEIQDRLGRPEEARESRRLATEEQERILEGLPPEQRRAFTRVTEASRVGQDTG